MKIKTKLYIVAFLPVFVFCATLALQSALSSSIDGNHAKEERVSVLAGEASSLITLTYEYSLTRAERARKQWAIQYKKIAAHLNAMSAQFETQEEQRVLEHLRHGHKDAGKRFSDILLIDAEERAPEGFYGPRNNMVNSLVLELQELLPAIDKLHDFTHAEMRRLNGYANAVTGLLLAILVLCILPIALIVVKRITSPIQKLHEGMSVISSGDLRHRVRVDSQDEIGGLGLGFNEMAGRIQEITVSRDELAREVAERRRAQEALQQKEAQLKEAQRIAHMGSWELDLTTNALAWSDEIYRIFEIDPKIFSATYEAFLNAIHPEDREAVNTAFAGSLQNKTAYDIQHRLLMRDGRIKFVQEHCATQYDSGGRPLRSVGTVQDITEQKRVEEEIRKLNEELDQRVRERTAELSRKSLELLESRTALMNIVEDLNVKTEQLRQAGEAQEKVNRELESFSYSVSHDLRAPLRAIDGFSLALQEDYGGKLDKEADNYINRIRAASQRMGQLIDDILNLSRLSRLEMNLQNVELSAVAEAAAEELKRAFPETRVDVVIQKGAFARCDARLMRIALTNLLGNAWKFSGKNPGPRVEFGVADTEKGRAFFVRDNGVGFDMAHADKLFSPFQRLHAVEEFPGAGIGLATVQRIIHRHNGRIWAEAETGKGATFYFIL